MNPSETVPFGEERETLANSGGRASIRVRVIATSPEGSAERADWVASEEPLEIRAAGPGQAAVSVAVTMRTPGHDAELAVGFLIGEGLVSSHEEIISIGPGRPRALGVVCNTVRVDLSRPFDGEALRRNFFATSSCGVCGKASLDQVAVRCPPVGDGPTLASEILLGLPGTLRLAQATFDRTGGLHAAGMFDMEGRLLVLREDVGRHNAVDKVVGRMALERRLPLAGAALLVSGRTSFEILQKAAVAGVPIVCAVSAPSSLAVATAQRLGITLVGFLRGATFNIYTHPDRIQRER